MTTVTACAVCGSGDLVPVTASAPDPRYLHHAQARCGACRLVVSQPRATSDEIAKYYGGAYYGEVWTDADRIVRENLEGYRRYEWPILQALWADWPPRRGGRVVEVGCGYGAMLPLLAEEGYAVSGCDPGGDAVRFCRSRGFDVVQGGIPGAPLHPPFVLTLCQHVIEHVEDPRTFVRELVALTEPGGVVALVTEDAWTSQWALERAAARIRGRWPRFHTSRDHTFVFSAGHLDRLLRDAGCDAVRTRTFSYLPAERPHWKLYKGIFRTLDRLTGHGEYLVAVGRVRP
ncbi:MAG: class I SAM-dependent methyltransferase [Vicinamibacterales bacterium]